MKINPIIMSKNPANVVIKPRGNIFSIDNPVKKNKIPIRKKNRIAFLCSLFFSVIFHLLNLMNIPNIITAIPDFMAFSPPFIC